MREKLKRLSENLSYLSILILLLVSIIVSTITQYNHLAYDIFEYTSTEFDYAVLSVAFDDGLVWGLIVFLVTGLFPLIIMVIKPTVKIVKRSTTAWYILAILLLLFLWNGSRPIGLNQHSSLKNLESNIQDYNIKKDPTIKFNLDTLDKKIGITDNGAKNLGSSLAYLYFCERDNLIPKDTFGDFLWSVEEILHKNHWEKVKYQYQESLHEKKQYSIAKDRWIPFKINQENCSSIQKALPTIKAAMQNKWKRENEKYENNVTSDLEKVYKSPNHDFNIKYPQSWNEIETAGKTVWEIQINQDHSVANCFVRVHDDQSFEIISNEEYLAAISKNQMSKELNAFFDEYNIHKWNKNTEFAGIKPTLGYSYTVKHPNSDIKESALIRQVIFNKKLYTFSCKAERDFFIKLRNTFDNILASFSFNY